MWKELKGAVFDHFQTSYYEMVLDTWAHRIADRYCEGTISLQGVNMLTASDSPVNTNIKILLPGHLKRRTDLIIEHRSKEQGAPLKPSDEALMRKGHRNEMNTEIKRTKEEFLAQRASVTQQALATA